MLLMVKSKSLHDGLSFMMCISFPALLSLSFGHHFNNLALKSRTRIEHVGCCLLLCENTSMMFSQGTSVQEGITTKSIL